jgi:hypothetical protein
MHPFVDQIIEWRRLEKLDGTYAAGMIPHILSDGRIHPTFRLDGTATGRVSSENPNGQNIPRPETFEGKMARDGFIVAPGRVMISLDQSQIELRVAAGMSGDSGMIQIFKDRVDYHHRTAELISKVAWGIASSAVTKYHRTLAKSVNFGLLYGKTDAGLAQQLGCSIEEAAGIRRAILGHFRQLAKLIEKLLYQVRRYGCVEIPWFNGASHTRPLYEAGGHDKWKKQNAENSSINCLDAETEALTQRGWVNGFELSRDDILLTKNPSTGMLEWQRMTDLKLWPDYEGLVVEFKSKSFHAVTTPEHRWLVRDKRTGLNVERTTRTLSQWGDHRIHRTGVYQPLLASVLSLDEAELLGWFVTDGSIQRTGKGGGKRGPKIKAGGVRAIICQSQVGNPAKCARIDALLGRLGHTVSRKVSRVGEVFWRLDHVLTEKLVKLAPERTLQVKALLQLDRQCLDRLRESMMLGDGTLSDTKAVFCTGRREQAEAFQILCTLTGNAASIVWRDMSMYSPVSKKMTNVPKMTGIWLVTILRRDTAQVTAEQRTERVTKCPVWCPIVPNTFFVARRSGTVYITGNSPVQGRAAWYTIAAIPLIHAWIDESGVNAEIINTVHDSIMLDSSKADADLVIANCTRIMEDFDCWGVPLVVDVDAGDRWGSLRSMERDELLRDAEVRWVAEHLIEEGQSYAS